MSEHNITVNGGSAVRLKTAGKYCDRDILVTAEGGDSVVESLEVTENGIYIAPDGVDGYSPVNVNVPVPEGYIKPNGTITDPGTADDLLSDKQMIDSEGNVVTGTIPTKALSDITASGKTVTIPSGYYPDKMQKSITQVTLYPPTISIDKTTGKITAEVKQTSSGYVAATTKTSNMTITTQAAKTVTPTTSIQTAVAANRYTTGTVRDGAIPSTYVQPSGTFSITENGTYSVRTFSSVDVNVATGGATTANADTIGTFTYYGHSYSFIKGMTWAEFCDSDMNVIVSNFKFFYRDNWVSQCREDGYEDTCMVSTNGEDYTPPSEEIIDGCTYTALSDII
jgi:hypothetical protein